MSLRAVAIGLWFSGTMLTALSAGTAGGSEVTLSLREGTNFAVARSPADGSLVLDLQGTLWRLPPSGGEATPLTDSLGDDRLPDVARDGARIVFQSYRNGTWDIWSMDPGGENAVALTEGPADDREPVLSPDGGRVAFSSDRSGNYDLWLLDLASGELTQLTKHEANDYMPAFVPSGHGDDGGDGLVFVSERGPDRRAALYRMSLAAVADEPVRLAELDGPVASPSVSPDGKRVAVRVLELGPATAGAMGRAATASRIALVAATPKASDPPRFLEGPEDVFPFRAQWTGAKELLYTASGAVWKQGLDEGSVASKIPFEAKVTLDRPSYRRRPVEFPASRERLPVRGIVRPVVSPDGALLVYAALGDLWLVKTEGGDPIPLTRDEALDTDPHWAPDSRSIVFSSDRSGTMDLWIKDVEAPPATGERRLTAAVGSEIYPAWAPDGRKIAYVDEQSRLHVIGVDGEGDRVLTAPRFGVGIPTWSSDSIHVAMAVLVPISTRFREGYNRILVVDVSTGSSRVLDQPDRSFGTRDGDGPVWRPDGGSLAFAMDGGLWTMPVSREGEPTGRPRRVVGEPADFPSWSADGSKLYFLGRGGLSVVDLASGNVSKIATRHEFEARSASGKLLIQNVRLVDGTGAPPRDGMDVFIDGNRIERIEPTGGPVDEEVRVVPGEGKTLIPGLIEMHCHLSLPSWGSRHGRVFLAYGVTSIRDPEDLLYRVLEERESIQAGRRVGPRVFFTGASMDGDRVYYTGAHAIGDSEELEQELTRAFDLNYDLVKTYVRLPDTLQKEAIERAHEHGIFVTSHEVYPAVAYGVDGIEHMSGTSRRGFSPKLTDLRRTYGDVVELIARSGVYFTPTVLVYGGWDYARAKEPELLQEGRISMLFPPYAQEALREAPIGRDVEAHRAVVAPFYETIDRIHEGGGKILAGTDSPIGPYGLSLLLEIEALSDAGLGPMGALESATRVAAEALGAGRDLGTIEEGRIADLVLLGADPSEDIRNLRRTELVIVNGRVSSVPQLLKTN